MKNHAILCDCVICKKETLTSGHTSDCTCRRCTEKREEKEDICPVSRGAHGWVFGLCTYCGEDIGPENSDDFMDLYEGD